MQLGISWIADNPFPIVRPCRSVNGSTKLPNVGLIPISRLLFALQAFPLLCVFLLHFLCLLLVPLFYLLHSSYI
jgi:hypothetical protein